MPPQSRGGSSRPRGLGVHSRSTPNLATRLRPIEPFPPIPEPPPKQSPTKSSSTPAKTSNDSSKSSAAPTKILDQQPLASPIPLTKATLDGAQQALLKPPPAFLTGTPSDQDAGSSPELDSSAIAEHDFASLMESTSSTSISDDEEEEEEQEEHSTPEASGHLPPLPSSKLSRPMYSSASRSHSSLGLPGHEFPRPHSVHALAPPFYNRPPTPLPPSPSLTSLLRPLPFSALPSRQTTPDSSDTEAAPSTTAGAAGAAGTTSSTAAVVAHSARTATTVPRASPKVPTYEYYGFVLYLGSSLAFAMYLLWSYLPTPFLHQLGIYYYPDRWWSLAIPAWLVMVIVYIFVALAAYNTGYMTLRMADLGCLVDEKGQVAVVDERGRIVRQRRFGGKEKEERGAGDGKATKLDGGQRVAQGLKSVGNDIVEQDGIMGVDGVKKQPVPELDWRTLWNEGTDAVLDVPLGGVCEILYGSGRETEDEDDDEYYD